MPVRRGAHHYTTHKPSFQLNILSRGTHDNLNAEGRIQGKPYQVTIDSGTSGTVALHDIVAAQPERKLSRAYVLQTTSGETIPVMEALAELTLGTRALRIWVFIEVT